MPRSEPTPNRRRIIAAIPKHAIRPLSRSSTLAVQRGNRIHQPQGFLRVVPVRADQANRERHAPARRRSDGVRKHLSPPSGRRGGIGKNGSTRFHNASGNSAAAIPVYATPPNEDEVSEALLHAL